MTENEIYGSKDEKAVPYEYAKNAREYVLNKAKECVCQDRNDIYGPPEDSFKTIAAYWNTYLKGIDVKYLTATDVAIMLMLMKIARTHTAAGEHHLDNYVDIAGYAACAAETIVNLMEELEVRDDD